VQGVAVLGGLIVLGGVAVGQLGSLTIPLATAPERLALLRGDESWLAVLEQLAIPICGTVVAVELISRFLGARSADVARAGTLLGGIVYLLAGLIPVFLGLAGPRLITGVPDTEQVIPRLAEAYLPGMLYVAFVGAIISAILSAVHSALHAPASQLSHNIFVRLRPGLSEDGKLWCVRATVMVLSIIAYLISVTSERIHDLVETASAFGSAGVFVTALFALFTRFGGPRSALVSVASGMLVWAAGRYLLPLPVPYLTGLLAATVGYVGVALVEARAGVKPHDGDRAGNRGA
jgi:Na+/proline symporter